MRGQSDEDEAAAIRVDAQKSQRNTLVCAESKQGKGTWWFAAIPMKEYAGEKEPAAFIGQPLCKDLNVDLYVGSGFQSITNAVRFVKRAVELKKPAHLLVISDHDPQGEKMPLAAARHVQYRIRQRFPEAEITVDALALTPQQIKQFRLPRVPIKESNHMRDKFEALYGKGATELDALEALHPGKLQAIVRKAVLAFRDESIGERLQEAQAEVMDALNSKWAERVEPIQKRVMATRKAAMAVAATYSERLAKLNDELQAKLRPYQQKMAALQRRSKDTVDEIVAELASELPERPAPMVAPDEANHLFDWRRGYFEQLDHFHAVSPPSNRR